jgi:2-oxoglutarate ferredoxin oxidoreductase subunit beta
VVRRPEDGALTVVPLDDPAEAVVHDAHAPGPEYAFALSRIADPATLDATPIGVLRDVERPVYGELMDDQLAAAGYGTREPDLARLLRGSDTWVLGNGHKAD